MWLDLTKHTPNRVDSSRHGYLLHTLGQDYIPNLLEFRILLRPTKPLFHFCIGVAASTCGTNIFQQVATTSYTSSPLALLLAGKHGTRVLYLTCLSADWRWYARNLRRRVQRFLPSIRGDYYLLLPSAKRRRLWLLDGHWLDSG